MGKISKILNGKNLSNLHVREVLKGASLSFLIKSGTALFQFLFNLVLARKFGAEGVGKFNLMYSIVFISSIFGRFGTDTSFLQFVSPLATLGQWEKVKGVYHTGMKIVSGLSFLVMIIIWLSADFLCQYVFPKAELDPSDIRLFSLAILPLAIMYSSSGLLRGIKKVAIALSIQGIILPLLTIIGLLVLAENPSVRSAVMGNVVSSVVAFIVSIILWEYFLGKHTKTAEHFPAKQLVDTSSSFFWVAMCKQVLMWSGIFIMGMFATKKDIGLFSIAVRIAQITSLFQFAFESYFAPKVGELFVKKDFATIGKVSRTSTAFVLLLVSPIFLTLFFFPKFVLSFFGPDFPEGSVALVLILIGYFINILMGPVGVILYMCGKEKVLRNQFFIAAMLILILNFCLVPYWGLLGAAAASSLTLILQNFIIAYHVYKEFGIVTVPFVGKIPFLKNKYK